MAGPARTFEDVTECAEQTLSRVGKRVVAALPLGIGNPNPFVSALSACS